MDKNYPHSQIVSQVISDITSQMDINNYDMGENIYLGNLFQKINSVNGVLNVIEIRVYNNVDDTYSNNVTYTKNQDNNSVSINLYQIQAL